MPSIIFAKSTGLQDSVYGKIQYPIRMFLEKRGEAFEQTSMIKEMYQMGTSENFADALTSMTAMRGFEPVGENGAYPADGFQEGFQKVLEYETWKNSFSVSREMVDDAKVMNMRQAPEAFLAGYHRARERFGAALYAAAIDGQDYANFGGKQFDVKAADGEPLFSTAHPPKVSGDAQSNMFIDAFDVDALGALETRMQKFKGDNKNLLGVSPDTISKRHDRKELDSLYKYMGKED